MKNYFKCDGKIIPFGKVAFIKWNQDKLISIKFVGSESLISFRLGEYDYKLFLKEYEEWLQRNYEN